MKRLYVESNFVCELVFAQESRNDCERILVLAEQQRVGLVLPAFCLAEPLETLGRRHQERRRLQEGIQKELRQLRRSDHIIVRSKTAKTVQQLSLLGVPGTTSHGWKTSIDA